MPGRGRTCRPRRHMVARNDNVAARNGRNHEPAPEPAPKPAAVVPLPKQLRACQNMDAGDAENEDVWVMGDSIMFWAGKRAKASQSRTCQVKRRCPEWRSVEWGERKQSTNSSCLHCSRCRLRYQSSIFVGTTWFTTRST